MPDRLNRFRIQAAKPWVIAHRGDSAHAPENTLEAARRAHEAGADAWEFDVQLTRDGVPILIHDATLTRTTDVVPRFADDPRAASGGHVADFDLVEIRSLDAGSWFLGPATTPRSAAAFGTSGQLDEPIRRACRAGQVRVPTLTEALELTAGLDWTANVELKSGPDGHPGLLDAVLEAIDATATADRVLISSFDHAEVARVARRRPEIATGVLVSSPVDRPGHYCRNVVGADGYHPSAEALTADADGQAPAVARFRLDDLDDLRQAAVRCFVYTVNDPAPGGLADRLRAAGVTGIFTDDPAALLETISRRPWRGGQSHLPPKNPQNRDSPRPS